jgi:hypothetical protein
VLDWSVMKVLENVLVMKNKLVLVLTDMPYHSHQFFAILK